MSKITNTGVFIVEGASAAADVAGSSQIWVKNTVPSTLFMTNDTGTDVQIASEMIPIQNIAVSSAANLIITLTGFTQYNSFKIFVDKYVPATDATKVMITHSNDSGSSYESANYYSIFGGEGCDGGRWNEQVENGAACNLTGNNGSDTSESSSFEVIFPNVHATDQRFSYYGVCNIWQHTPHVIAGETAGVYTGDTLATTNIKFQPDSGNIEILNATLYGINEVAS